MDAYTANNGYLTTETDPTVNAAAKADLSTCAEGDVLLLNSSLAWECSTNVSGTGKWSDGTTANSIVYTGGNVGIGTDEPGAKLEILDNDPTIILKNNSSNQASSGAIIFDESDGNKHFQMQYDGLYDQLNFVGLDSSYVDLMSIERKGNVGIGTNSPAARLHVESSQRANSINRSCPAGTLWAGHIAGKASVDWNNDGYTDGNDYNILLGIDTNDYLEDNECVVFGTSTIGTDIDSGEFWVDTNLNRIVDEGEVITGANLGKPNVSGGKVSCETGHLWLDQNLNGYSPETGECIAPQYDDDSVILRTDFTGETCPVGTQKRDENQDGNTDDGECHIPAVLAKADGNLGIGTTAPQQALHVNGGIMASSLLLEDHNNPTFQAKDFFAHSHSIATEGAIDFESFSIDGETYLAVANYRNDSTRNIESHIYQWNSTTNQFDKVQDIETNGARDFASFTIDGQTYLAVANYRNDSTRNIESHIYQWNSTTNQFDKVQDIETNGARDFASFTIDGQTYLAVANYHNDSTYNNDSYIYQWNSTTNQFDQIQAIATNGAHDFASFTIDGQTYLAVANHYNDSTNNIESHIYQWNSTTNQFDQIQAIATNGARDFESFTIDGQTYLAVANYYNGSTYNLDSHIYQWNSTTNQFDQIQAIATNGTLDFESFTIDGQTYLAVANHRNDSTYNIDSHIYQWSSTTNQFDQIQAIATNGAHDFESFTIDGQTYLAVANYYNGSTRNLDSHIYTYDSFLSLSSTSTLAENNPLFVFQNGEEELMTIENSGNVGIGTGSPNAKLDINDSSGNAGIQLVGRELAYRHAYKTLTTEEGGSWYRIAEKDSGRASARFAVNEIQSSRHSTAVFYASSFFSGNNYWDSSLSLLNRSYHGGNSCIRKVRIVTGDTTYDPAYVEIFVNNTATSTNNCGVRFSMYDNEHYEGWDPVDFLQVPEDAESPEYEALSPGQYVHSDLDRTNQQPYYRSNSVLDFTDSPIMAVANKTGDIFRVAANGTVGIGTTEPGARLEVIRDSGSIFNAGTSDNKTMFQMISNGTMEIAGNVVQTSDSRYKKEIQTLPSALENILSLRGVSYYWKDRSDNTEQIGVIAQEVEKIYPQLVHTNEDGYKSVAYSNLVSPLIEAVKELHALYQGHADRIAVLEAQNAHQDERIAQLEEQNSALEEQNVGLLKTVVQLEVRLAALEAAQ